MISEDCTSLFNTHLKKDYVQIQIYFGQNSVRYFGPLIWHLILNALRNVESFVEFKSLIKNWKNHLPAPVGYGRTISLKLVL